MRPDDLQAPLRSCAVDRWPQDGQTTDVLAAEVPVALEFNGISHAVMLATPQDLEAFALGFAFGVPTMMLEYYQGIGLGAMMAVFSAKGLGYDFGGWLFIHGTTELFAILLVIGITACSRTSEPGNEINSSVSGLGISTVSFTSNFKP